MLPLEYLPALPELILAGCICLLLLVDLFISDKWRDLTYLLAIATLLATAFGVMTVMASTGPGTLEVFAGSFVSDPLASFLKSLSLITLAVIFVYSRAYLRDQEYYKGEYYLLSLFALLGIQVMVSAGSMLTMYLGLEMLSLALYGLVAFDRDSPMAAEAAMKYFVLGAIASGCLLYGISVIYGVTGSVTLTEVSASLASGRGDDLAVLAGLALIIVGVAFKFGGVPFHMWLPDVYAGAPMSVTLLIGTVPKLAAFALMLRVVSDGLAPLAIHWELVLAFVGVASLALGNVVAIAQTNVKRMLAYSTIGHVGFILLGFSTASRDGTEAALFYTVVYVIMAAAAFGTLILLGRRGDEADQLDDLRGLNQRSPWFAAMLLLVMVSMIGIPPLAGFYAKWWVLAALIDAGHIGLALAAVVFSVVGAFYYLRVIKLMYFDGAQSNSALRSGADLRAVLSANALLVLGIGLFPDALIELCARALG